jgi:antitoxin ParD1/3/4
VAQVDTFDSFDSLILMPARRTMNVSITPELESFVAETVATGRFSSASEVVRAGLRLLEQQQRRNARKTGQIHDRMARQG